VNGLCPQPVIQPKLLGRPSRSVVTVRTVLPRLRGKHF
jgi:hypothetical protein